jgi:hypothetical protein
LHPQGVFGAQTPLMHKAGKAARAVAALLYLAAIGVVDDVFNPAGADGARG